VAVATVVAAETIMVLTVLMGLPILAVAVVADMEVLHSSMVEMVDLVS
jgi:hypothetical protein